MKQNNKLFGKFKLALLVLCAILLSLTAVISVGIFGAKNTQTASAVTDASAGRFITINSGKDIFDSKTGKFDKSQLISFNYNFFGCSDGNISSSEIKSAKDLLVNIGGKMWTPLVGKHPDGAPSYVMFWLASTTESMPYGTSWDYDNSNVRKYLTGNGSGAYAQSAEWKNFQENLSDYMLNGVGCNVDDSYKGDYLFLPSAFYINYNSYFIPTTNQKVHSNATWCRAFNINEWMVGLSTDGSILQTSKNIPETGYNSSYAVRPCFILNMTKAFAEAVTPAKETPKVTPNVTYTGNLYTSSKFPTITTSSGDTAGTIAWTDSKLTAGTNEYNWKFTPSSTTTYSTLTGKYTLTVLPVELDRITAGDFDPDTNSVYTNTPLNTIKEYITVKAYNTDGSLYDTKPDTGEDGEATGEEHVIDGIVPSEDYDLYGTLTEGTCTLTVVYKGKTCTVKITGVQDADEVTFDKLIITKLPEKLSYYAYEKLNTTGMEVTARYSDGDKIITDYTIVYLDDVDGNEKDYFLFGDKKIIISYTDGETEQTAEIAVTIAKAKSIVNPVVSVSGVLYTSNGMPKIAGTEGDTAGVFAWDDIDGAPAKLTAGTKDYKWTFTPTDEKNYEVVCGEHVLTAHEVVLDKIIVEYEPETKVVDGVDTVVPVYTSTALDKIKNVKVKGVNNDGTPYDKFDENGYIPLKTAEEEGYVLSGKLVEGANTVTVTYGGKVATFEVENVIKVALDKVTAKYPVNAHNVYASYTLDQLKAELEVKAVYNDGSEEVLSYYELINNLADETDPNLTVKYGDKKFSFLPDNFVGTVSVTSIDASFNATDIIYASTPVANLKKYLTVKLNYDDGSSEEVAASGLNGLNLVGTLKAGSDNEITVTYLSKAATFKVAGVKAVEISRIEVSWVENLPEDFEITTATNLETLKNYLNVHAIYNDSDKKVLIDNPSKISLIGSLKSPESEIVVVYSDSALNAQSSVVLTIKDVKQSKAKPNVAPKVTIGGVLVEGKALPAISLAEGSTAGTIEWVKVKDEEASVEAGSDVFVDPVLKAGQEKYVWKFVPADGDKFEEVTGEYWLTADAAKVIKLTVTRALASGTIYTDLIGDDLKECFKVVASFNDGRDDKELNPADFDISAVLKVGTSNVVFSYTDNKGNTVTETVPVTAESREGEKTVNVGWDGESEYEYSGKQPKLSAYTTNTTEKIVLEYKFEKKNADGTYTAVEKAVDAGEYRAVAQDVAGKYKVGRGEYFYFTVTPKNVVRPVALSGTDYKYTGNEQEFLLEGFDATIMTVTGNKQTEAGTYTVTVALTDDNYKFAVGDGTASSLSYVFNIVKDASQSGGDGTPVVTVEGNGLSTGLMIGIIVAVVAVLFVAVVAIIIALKNKGGSDNDGFYDVVQ